MTRMRAKVRVGSVLPHRDESEKTVSEQVRLYGVPKSNGYPADGTDEDNTFAKYSPSATLMINVANPALFGKFNHGDKFYVDFTPAP